MAEGSGAQEQHHHAKGQLDQAANPEPILRGGPPVEEIAQTPGRYGKPHAQNDPGVGPNDQHQPGRRFSPDAVRALQQRPWPGNVRELRNAVERLLILAQGKEVTALDVGRLLTAVYRASRWWLCESSVDKTGLFTRTCDDGTSSCVPSGSWS